MHTDMSVKHLRTRYVRKARPVEAITDSHASSVGSMWERARHSAIRRLGADQPPSDEMRSSFDAVFEALRDRLSTLGQVVRWRAGRAG